MGKSTRPYRGLGDLDYPCHDWTATITTLRPDLLEASEEQCESGLAGQDVEMKQVSDRIWLLTFVQDDLGYFDDESCRLETIENPFGPKVLPMSPE